MKILIITTDKKVYYSDYIDFRNGMVQFTDNGREYLLGTEKIAVIRAK